MGHNPYLDQFLMFYSQSETGNGLTRGLDNELARRTYVPTKLDSELAGAILDKRYRLVILTGNAGDGKTAFIQKVEEAAQQRGAQVVEKNDLGTQLTHDGWTFKTLFDGSVESGATSNQNMLEAFFVELGGEEPLTDHVCMIVAMNEGKLRDFLSHTKKFPWLSRTLLDHILKGSALPDDVVVVNLNLRSIVDTELTHRECLFDQILHRYVAEEFWAPCGECECRHRCPVKFNVDTFRVRPTEGVNDKDRDAAETTNKAARTARSRLKAIFQVLHFRKRIHITVRDLRSVLAFALFGKTTCAQLEAEIQIGETDYTERYYYNAIFNASEKDRVLSFLREFDVGQASSPQVDSVLSFTKPGTPEFDRLFHDFVNHRYNALSRAQVDAADLLRLYKGRPMSPEERTPKALAASRNYVLSLRRKLYFEGRRFNESGQEKPYLDELLPYDNVNQFIDFIRTGQDPQGDLKEALVLAISRSESIYDDERGKENICILTRQDPNAKVKAFFTYPASDFQLRLPGPGPQARYIEYVPASILLAHSARNIELEISLDLYEMLMRIKDGYVPAAGEMRAFFLNLLMFKKQLMATPPERLLLTETDYQLFELKRTAENGVSLSVL